MTNSYSIAQLIAWPETTGLHILLSAFLMFAACSAGNGDGLDISGRPVSEGGNVELAATLESIQSNVFDPFCVLCHAGAAAPLGLRLDAVNSFTNLVGVPSRQAGSILRVAPGNPAQSYLVQKLEGSARAGERMPLGGPALPPDTISFVRRWIAEGAMPASAVTNSPPVIVSLMLDPTSTGSTLPAQILAGFDQEIDASTINTQTFLLMRSGGDGRFDDDNDVVIAPSSVGLSSNNPQLAVMRLDGVAAIADVYRIELKGTGPSLVLNLGGIALDGEFSGSFASGDGIEGGDFRSEFSLQGANP